MLLKAECQSTKSGLDTLFVNGVYFHSKYDPLREAKRLAVENSSASIVILLSPGLGYLTHALESQRVFAIERHQQINDLSKKSDSLVGLSSDQIFDWAYANDELLLGKVRVISGVSLDEDAAYYADAAKAIQRAIEKRAEEELTCTSFEKIWVGNIQENSKRFPKANWISELDGTLEGKTAIIFAAGPSLENDLRQLSKYLSEENTRRNSMTIFSVDSALPAAIANQISPDFCISIDPQPVKALSLEQLDDVPLIASVLSPSAVLGSARRCFLFTQGHPDESKYEIPAQASRLDTGGSVATAAVILALRWGAEKIVLLGQDLSLVSGQMHSRGVPDHLMGVASAGRFSTVELSWGSDAKASHTRNVPGVGGTTVLSTPSLDSFRHTIQEIAAQNPNVEIISTSPRGAEITNVTHVSLFDALKVVGKLAEEISCRENLGRIQNPDGVVTA
ncbi:MAG: DUF115 domain-containing protein [Candidatus Lindowbacteria bacterium]|nr:DUF115 domain-containing protein [Candidatus Lindowbacteria bacterium]